MRWTPSSTGEAVGDGLSDGVDDGADGATQEGGDAAELGAPAQAAPASLSERLQAARAAALAADAGDDTTPTAHPAQPAGQRPGGAGTTSAQGAVRPPQRPWWRRLWPGRDRAAAGAASRSAAWDPGKLVPLFKPRFMWPIRPQRVADWARRHGALTPLAPPGGAHYWPHRQIAAEPQLWQQARASGQRTPVQLHLMTAAVVVGDRRMRVLLDSQGQVLGPRAYDPRRLAAALGSGMAVLMVAVALAAWHWPRPGQDGPGELASATEAPALAEAGAASAAAGAASATDPTAAHGAGPTAEPAVAATDHGPATPDPAAALPPASDDTGGHAAAGAEPRPSAAGHEPADRTAQTPAPAGPTSDPTGTAAGGPTDQVARTPGAEAAAGTGDRLAQAGTGVDAASARLPEGVTSTPPPAFPRRRASGPVAQIRPLLSSEERLLARQQSEAARAQARGEPVAPAATQTRYAVLSTAWADRADAEAQLAPMMSVRAQLPAPGPAFTELVQQNGRWRAALWPFATQADADQAREMMNSRGVKSEVMPF